MIAATAGTWHVRWVDFISRATPLLAFVAAISLILVQSYLPIVLFLMWLRWIPLMLLAAGAVARVLLEGRLPRTVRWFDVNITVFIAVAMVSSLYSLDPHISAGRAVSVAIMYVAVFWGIWMDVARHTCERIARTLVTAVAIAMLLNIAAIPFQQVPLTVRFLGIMNSPNALGTLVALNLPLVLWAALEPRGRRYWIIVLVMVVSVEMSQSRSSVFATFIGTSYFLFHALPRARVRLAAVAAVCVLIAVILPQATWVLAEYPARRNDRIAREKATQEASVRLDQAQQALRQREIQLQNSPSALAMPDAEIERLRREVARARLSYERASESLRTTVPQLTLREIISLSTNPRHETLITGSGRFFVWELGLQYLRERPWTGFGFGAEDLILPSRGFGNGLQDFYGFYFHNSYLGLALQVGIVGALLFFCPLLALAFAEWRAPASYAQQPLRFALRAVLLTGLVVSCLESWPYSMGNAFSFLFWTCVMLLAWMRYAGVEGSTARKVRR